MRLPFETLMLLLSVVWLAAGLVDYVCHRLTHIESNAGVRESMLHLAQFLVLGAAVSVAVTVPVTRWSYALVVIGSISHSALAFVDVSFTDGRRYLSPLEQQVHGYLEVLPLVATALLGTLHWDALASGKNTGVTFLNGRDAVLTIVAYAVLAGTPVIEELLRTLRYAMRNERQSNGTTA
jgi:hypothetical protein